MFPNDETCLEYLFQTRFSHLPDYKKYHRIKGRRCYVHSHTGHQIYPCAGTIFHKSTTPLRKWFYAIYLVSQAKNGVSAEELRRHLGVTYKCAWRIAQQIKRLMDVPVTNLEGIIEADETFIGGRQQWFRPYRSKVPVMGVVERDGRVITKQLSEESFHTGLTKTIREHASPDNTLIMTDEYGGYKNLRKLGYNHLTIQHGRKEYVRGGVVHTNTIEGYWGQLKRSLSGTHHSVSPKYLQAYLNEYSFRYNLRNAEDDVFYHLIARL